MLNKYLTNAHQALDELIAQIREDTPTQEEAMNRIDALIKQLPTEGIRSKDKHTVLVKSQLFLRNVVLNETVHGFYHNGQFYSTNGAHARYYGNHGISQGLATTLLDCLPSGLYWKTSLKEWFVSVKGRTDV